MLWKCFLWFIQVFFWKWCTTLFAFLNPNVTADGVVAVTRLTTRILIELIELIYMVIDPVIDFTHYQPFLPVRLQETLSEQEILFEQQEIWKILIDLPWIHEL